MQLLQNLLGRRLFSAQNSIKNHNFAPRRQPYLEKVSHIDHLAIVLRVIIIVGSNGGALDRNGSNQKLRHGSGRLRCRRGRCCVLGLRVRMLRDAGASTGATKCAVAWIAYVHPHGHVVLLALLGGGCGRRSVLKVVRHRNGQVVALAHNQVTLLDKAPIQRVAVLAIGVERVVERQSHRALCAQRQHH